jgi:hypothetical protein
MQPDYLFWEPLPQCGCEGDSCAPRACGSDNECLGDEGLCARTPNEDREGYCVDATCSDLSAEYEQVAELYNTCSSDDDCSTYSPINRCCDAFAVNQEGVQEMQVIDAFATRTSCGDDWRSNCELVDCAMPPEVPPSCVEGQCSRSY